MKLIGPGQILGLPVKDNSDVSMDPVIWATLQYMKDMTVLSSLEMYGGMENAFRVPKGDTSCAAVAPCHCHASTEPDVHPYAHWTEYSGSTSRSGIYLLYGGIYLLCGCIYLLCGGVYLLCGCTVYPVETPCLFV